MSEHKYSEAKLQEFKQIIQPLLKETDERLSDLKETRKRRTEHFADMNVDFNESSAHFQQQSKNKASMRRLKTKSKELNQALLRIENGTYGVCERTGRLIDEKRLKALPTARVSMRAK
ncbi:TraR/DksA family transcriptional regulator [Portibacter lacus]|uniref:Molecular chaperone DnaK n=1 Tax=Portibacter lacus TaxID=1099794 RepID=A0AA37SPC2_9BACT|nr:TraR/DksA C4-type zinc finger protein [Portibacter lacus]GLR17537.1 molecular chaperone DnaK [Portibacter lacus]